TNIRVDTNNLGGLPRFRHPGGNDDTLTDGIDVWPEFVCRGLVDEGHTRCSIVVVGLGERPTPDKMHTHQVEIVRTDVTHLGQSRKVEQTWGAGLDADSRIESEIRIWKRHGQCRALDSRKSTQSCPQSAIEPQHL